MLPLSGYKGTVGGDNTSVTDGADDDERTEGAAVDDELIGGVIGNAAQVGRVHGDIYFGGARPPEQPVPHQLPSGPLNLIGRSTQFGLLDAWAETTSPIVMSHPAPGVGKSALVVRWAASQATRFPDGILHFDLRGSDPSGVARRAVDVIRDVLRAFGVNPLPPGEDAQLALYRTLLATKSVLLVLDDALDSNQVLPLLPPGARSLAVITSRSQLADLAGRGGRPLPVDVLNREDAHALLTALLGQDRAAAEPVAVTQLVEISGGLPGALGTIAGLAGTTALADLAAELSSDPTVSTAPDAAARARAIRSWAQSRTTPPRAEWRQRLSSSLPGWVNDRRVLLGVAAAMCASVVAVSISLLEASGLLGGIYLLLRFALLGAGLTLMERGGARATLAAGVVAGSAVYFLVDALVSIHSRARFLTWLELIMVAAFVTLMVVRWRPLQYLPHRLHFAPLGSRPLAFVLLGGLLAWFVLLFVGVESYDLYASTFTVIEEAGPLGGLLPLAVIGAVCAAIALADLDEPYPIFAAAAVFAYFVPEVILLIGSLAFGDQFSYLGNAVFFIGGSVPWFTVMQAIVAATLTAGTVLLASGRKTLRRKA